MLQRYLLTFCNQGIVSLFNFVLTLSLVRQWEVYDFGIFALILQITLTLEGFQNALVATPLSVWAPAMTRRAPRVRIETTLWSVGSVLMIGVAIGAALITAMLTDDGGWLVAAAVSGFLVARLVRHYGRAYLFARLQPGKVAIADVGYVAIGSVAVALVWWAPDAASLIVVLALLTAGSLIGTVASLVAAGCRLRPAWRRRTLAHYLVPWRTARWGLVGVTTTTIHTRSHAAVVTGFFGPELFAVLAAGEALVGPIRTALQAWGMITRPTMATAYGRNDQPAIDRMNGISLLLLGGGLAAFAALLWAAWGPISNAVYGDKYADMSLIVGLWVVIVSLLALRTIISITLQAMRAFRELAFATAYGAGVSLAAVTGLALVFGFEYSLIGLALGEAVVLGLLTRAYLRLRTVSGTAREAVVPESQPAHPLAPR